MEGRDTSPPRPGRARGLGCQIVGRRRHRGAVGVAGKYRAGTLRLPFENPAEAGRLVESLDGNRVLIVAERDDLLVGTAGWNHPKRAARAHTAAIGVGVHDGHVGQGIGTALLTALVDAADDWYAIRRLKLETFADNERAIRLYWRFGFEVEGTMREYAFRAGRYVDALSMARIRRV